MRLFLTILRGPSPAEAKPILATEDDRLIQLVRGWIAERLASGAPISFQPCISRESEQEGGAE